MAEDDARVLVIDDSEISLELMAGVLEDSGVAVVKLPGPIGATQAVIKRNIQVLVTDVNMPALPGHNLISLFRGNRRTKHVRVVLVSSLPEDQLQEIAKESGADGVVQKDSIEAELPRLVKRLLRERPSTRASDPGPAEDEDRVSSPMSSVRARLTKLSSRGFNESLRKFHQEATSGNWQEITEV